MLYSMARRSGIRVLAIEYNRETLCERVLVSRVCSGRVPCSPTAQANEQAQLCSCSVRLAPGWLPGVIVARPPRQPRPGQLPRRLPRGRAISLPSRLAPGRIPGVIAGQPPRQPRPGQLPRRLPRGWPTFRSTPRSYACVIRRPATSSAALNSNKAAASSGPGSASQFTMLWLRHAETSFPFS